VRENPLADDKTPENPIRRFIIGPQIFSIIKSALMDPELEELPTDLQRGLDFRVTKTSKGGYADYNTSKWARKESALTEAEQAAIEAHGLFDLSTFLPKKPSESDLKVIKEMFEASVDGEAYDPARWSQYYRPAGVSQATGDPLKPSAPRHDEEEALAAPAASAPVTPSAPAAAPVESAGSTDGASRAQDILAMIRNRQK
jgi:hypothetical protein